MTRKLLIYGVAGLFICWLLVLPFRSLLFVTRVYNEFKTGKETYKPEISACTNAPTNVDNFEDERLLNYRKLDKRCEK